MEVWPLYTEVIRTRGYGQSTVIASGTPLFPLLPASKIIMIIWKTSSHLETINCRQKAKAKAWKMAEWEKKRPESLVALSSSWISASNCLLVAT